MEIMPIGALKGKTLSSIVRGRAHPFGSDVDERIAFVTEDGEQFLMYHQDDCCETVRLAEVIGDLNDLVGSPIIEAEEVVSAQNPAEQPDQNSESWTWTFYKFGTVKGHVTLRWLGESNGYYSESVNLYRVDGDAFV